MSDLLFLFLFLIVLTVGFGVAVNSFLAVVEGDQ